MGEHKPVPTAQQHEQTEGDLAIAPKTKLPKKYKVMLLNDDFTPMDFVVHVLQRFFQKNQEDATQVMLEVHQKGAGVAGIFTLEVAEMKAMQVNQYARLNKHPLKSIVEIE